jgi:hypothetical protein
MVSGGITQGQVAAAWQSTGADVSIGVLDAAEVTPAVLQQIRAVPAARHVAAASTTTWILPDQTQINLIEVNPAQYAALTSDTPFPPVRAAALATHGTTYPVLADPATAALLGGHPATITALGQYGHISIRAAGTVASSPAAPAGGHFAIIGSPVPWIPPGANLILITGNVNQAALESAIAGTLPGATVTDRTAELASLAATPLVHAAALLMTLSVFACSVLAVVSLLAGLALGAGERRATMARLAVMGHQREIKFVLLNALPALLGAAVAAIACTLALPGLVGPALDLSAFTSNQNISSNVSAPFRPDLMALCLPGATIAILAGAMLILQARRSRRDVTGMLRVGS